jgi:hypothetical protein
VATALASVLAALAASQAMARDAGSDRSHGAARTATIAVVTTQEVRVAVVARRVTRGPAPTAEVRVGLARRVGGSWREFAEQRLSETYFWNTVIGPHSFCRLAIETVATRRRPGSQVKVQLLLSPSVGCGRVYSIPLPTR